MSKKITGGVTEANLTSGESHVSVLIFRAKWDREEYKGALIPMDDESRALIGRFPKEIGMVMEFYARGHSEPLLFEGSAKIGNMQEKQDHLFLIMMTNNGPFILVFDGDSTQKLGQKSVGKAELKDQHCEILFEF